MCAAKSDTLYITDTTLRDAHQSLIATRLRTEDMLPLARAIDNVGFFSWRHAPPYLTYALERGACPENIRLQDAREALCRTQG